MALTVARFDRADVDVLKDIARRADLFGSAEAHAGAILDCAADCIYRAEEENWIATWRTIQRAKFYASAVHFPSVSGLTLSTGVQS